MKYFWYAFLGLFSLGFVGFVVGIIGIIYIFSDYGKDLPDYSQLKDYKPPIVTRLYAGDGRLVAEFAQEKRVFMPIETMPELLKNAFISAEDKNFYTHDGVDFIAITRAMLRNIKNIGGGGRPEGASTITQQVAKNFLLTSEVSYERKIKEAILAYRMERAMTKDRLLELYLNEIYLGQRAYGVAAASLQYFNKALSELEIHEMAYLAALPKAPNNYHPVRKHDQAKARRNWVIDRMEENGYIELAQADLAKLMSLEMIPPDSSRKISAPYFTEEVRRYLAQNYGEESLYGGGLAVRSTIDPHMQKVAVKSLREGLEAYDRRHGYRGAVAQFDDLENWQERLPAIKRQEAMPSEWKLALVLKTSTQSAEIGFKDGSTGKMDLASVKWARKYIDEGYSLGSPIDRVNKPLNVGDIIMTTPRLTKEGEVVEGLFELKQIPDIQGAIVAMDPHTGRILALQGGWKYRFGSSEFNRATQAKRQSGSAFKPFVYIAALEKDFTPATLVLDAPFVIEDRPGHFWSPSNYSNEYYGPTPIRVGVEKSRNLMTVRLADFLGMELITDYAKRLGVVDDMPPLLSYSLGAGETTLMDITSAYAVFVNGGKKVTPILIDRIQDRRGTTVLQNDERPCQSCGQLIKWQEQSTPDVPDTREQIIDPRTAYQMTSILEGVVQRGTGVRIRSLGRPLAGKTGTTNKSKDTWFIGYSPDLVVGVFAGFDEPRSLGKRETGSSVSVPIFKNFMAEALKGEPIIPFRIPKGIRNVQINAETGARAQAGDKEVIWEAFIEGTEPTDDVYILDGRGISMMPATGGDGTSAPGQEAHTGTGGLY